MNEQKFVIAIDGPVASGKGTIASKLAKDLHGLYLYTGAMYRIVALVGLEGGVDLHDEAAIVKARLISTIDGAICLYNPGFIGFPCRNFHPLTRLL